MAPPNTLLFHREAWERPKSEKFLKFIEEKKASRRCDFENDRESKTSTTRTVPLIDDATSLDPTISELTLSKLIKPITHQDRKLFMTKLAHKQEDPYRDSTESRQDKNTLGSVNRIDKCSTHTTHTCTTSRDHSPDNDHDRSSRCHLFDSNHRKQSISQRLAKAERYTKFKERHTSKSVKDTTAFDKDTKEQGEKNNTSQQSKISDRLKKAMEKLPQPTGEKETEVMADCTPLSKDSSDNSSEKETHPTQHKSNSALTNNSESSISKKTREISQKDCNAFEEALDTESREPNAFEEASDTESREPIDYMYEEANLDTYSYSSNSFMQEPQFTLEDLSVLEEASDTELLESIFPSEEASLNTYPTNFSLAKKIQVYDKENTEEIEAKLQRFSEIKIDTSHELATAVMETEMRINIESNIAVETLPTARATSETEKRIDIEPTVAFKSRQTRDSQWRLTPALKMLSSILIGADLPAGEGKRRQQPDFPVAPVSSLEIDVSDQNDECSLLTTDMKSHFSMVEELE